MWTYDADGVTTGDGHSFVSVRAYRSRPYDRRVVACNVTDDSSAISAGSKAYVVLSNPGGGHDRLKILARSRGGRWIEKWESIHRLTDFRAVTLPPEHPRYDSAPWGYDNADTLATELRDTT